MLFTLVSNYCFWGSCHRLSNHSNDDSIFRSSGSLTALLLLVHTNFIGVSINPPNAVISVMTVINSNNFCTGFRWSPYHRKNSSDAASAFWNLRSLKSNCIASAVLGGCDGTISLPMVWTDHGTPLSSWPNEGVQFLGYYYDFLYGMDMIFMITIP